MRYEVGSTKIWNIENKDMKKDCPLTKEIAFAQLDEMLSEEDKQAIIEKDVIELHFTLGLWIRNNWLYPQSDEEIRELLKTIKKRDSFFDSIPFHIDDVSSEILEAYKKHLKRTLKK
jgi:hypothetical protein